MKIPVVMILFFSSVLGYNILSSFYHDKMNKNFDSFLRKQTEYYNKPKSILEKLKYITLSVDDKNFLNSLIKEEIHYSNYLIEKLISLLNKKMIKLNSNISNYQLRKLYGDNNMKEILTYYDNYNEFTKLIVDISKIFIEENQLTLAQNLLKIGISLDTDISDNYSLLGKLYYDSNKQKDLKLLVKKIQENKNISQKRILIELKKYLNIK